MTLIKSISGIRGTIGGKPGDNLTPLDVVKFATSYGVWLKRRAQANKPKVIIGRDARISGPMVKQLIGSTLMGLGIDVVDIDLATTPTTEMAVTNLKANGGIIITASHNPKQWNALKLLNEKGEFLNGEDGEMILGIAENESLLNEITYADVDELGKLSTDTDQLEKHIDEILALPYVDVRSIKEAKLTIAIDCVNSVGGIAIPALLKRLGVNDIIELFTEPNGYFPHNPEPLPENLGAISEAVLKSSAHLGFVVDPDVDRLAIVNEDGSMFGEEYTLVAVADYLLKYKPGNTVSNLSSSRALRDVTLATGNNYYASAVGEVNVVEMMKSQNASIGGEGNGGIILPDLHYGRDALVGIALFLTHYVKSGLKCSELRATYPEYFISKNKIELSPELDVDLILENVKTKYSEEKVSTVDGVKIDFPDCWVHLRKSNTEPIIRIYSEAKSMAEANGIARQIINDIEQM
jgi:phosphomannomutase